MFPSKIGFHSSILTPRLTSTLGNLSRGVGNYGTMGYVLMGNINKRERFFVTTTNANITVQIETTSTSANPFFVITGTNAFATPIELKINNGEYIHIGMKGSVVGTGTLSLRSNSSTGTILASVAYQVISGGRG